MHSVHRILWNAESSSAQEGRFVRNRQRCRCAKHWLLPKLTCVLFLSSSLSLPQRVVTATANIPFDFWGEGRSLPLATTLVIRDFPVQRRSTAREQN